MVIQLHSQTITIDNRETKLIELFRHSKIHIETANLPIGDIILKHTVDLKNETTNDESRIIYEFIIERKCIQDMIASIKDGRYKEQKIRLLAESKNTTSDRRVIIAYIIEGTCTELRFAPDRTMLLGSIISSTFRDKIPILRTNSLQETFDLLIRMNERLNKDYADFFPTSTNSNPSSISSSSGTEIQAHIPETDISTSTSLGGGARAIVSYVPNDINYLAAIKKNKKDNMTPAVWNMNCLCGIPGVSSAIAIKIAERYPTIKQLLEAYQVCTDSTARESLLADIILTETDKQRRRIGNVISKRVYEYFYQ